ncbi:MAG TPA: SDR family NAD(P)-dependent oxidoreductase [Pseudonocardiaceae bacterium]|nr:SDR family NAD(P)-dependent oxidoreductase [Pseudonocardiaceae bacterium]
MGSRRRHPVLARLARSPAVIWLVNPHGSVADSALRAAVDGKIILVTGASYGVGRATAIRLGGAGAIVLLVARTVDALNETAARIAESGGEARVYPTDLADPDAVDALAKLILTEHGHVDVVVSNAGKSIRRAIADSYDRFHDFERTIGVNYLGPVKLLLALLPSIRARGEGHLVNVSTIGVQVPPGPRWAAYQASKVAFDVFFRSTATEIAGEGITASSVYLALVRTRMSAPTRTFRGLPGLTAEQAAELVCRAIVERPRRISPWWAGAMEAGAVLTRRPWEVISGRLYQQSTKEQRS